ncbi:hypothetical protein Tco_1319384 [Tanacetum coccineum]
MRISEWMLTEEMKQTEHYKLYATEFGLDVPMTRSQPIESTQGTHKTPSAPRPPNPVEHQGELSAQRKPTIIRIRRRSQPDPETPILGTTKIDVTNLDEATQMSIAIDRIIKDLEAQQKVKKVEEHLVNEEIEKINPDTKIEPKSHKERPEVKKSVDLMIIDENEEEESTEDALRWNKGKGIYEIKDTPLTTTHISPRTHTDSLSSDKEELKEFLAFEPSSSSPKPKTEYVQAISNVVHVTLKKVVPPMVDKTTNDIVKKNLPKVVAKAIRLERQKVDSFLRDYMNNNILHFEKHVPLVESCRVTVVRTRDHGDHDDDARPEGESSAKRQKTSEHGTYTRDDQGIDDDEVPSEEVSPELLAKSYMESQIVWESKEEETLKIPKKLTPVFQSCVRNPKIPLMSLVNQDLFYLKNANSETRKYVPSLHKIHAFSFLENDLEELNTRWVKKTIKRQLKMRDDSEKVYSEKKIVDVIKVKFDQGYGQEYIEEIMVKIADGEYLEFTVSYYKYLYKNDIEDMYLMCINGKIKDYRETGLLKSLILFIRNYVIWERVYDYQLGLEIYQQKVNFTTPTLTFADLSKEDAEYMMFYEEYIQERLRHRDQMRCWESYVNGRPLDQRSERLE